MKKRSRLRGKVVVITGASSGIGRETAVRFAAEGCRLVLAARRQDELAETARLCREVGGVALVVPTDVSHEADVLMLARRAIEEFGEIDVWVNNAGVTLFALLTDRPFEEHKRVIETNLFGSIHGARAVVPHFKKQGHGVLINVGSVLSKVGQPYVPSYVISKFALRGLTETLRTEVAEHRDIHICSFLPYAIDTPHFASGANFRGRHARPMPPLQSPEKVARAIVSLAARPRRERVVPRVASLGIALHWLFPRTVERLLLRALARWHFDGRPLEPTGGNLNEPMHNGPASVHGEMQARLSTPVFAAWAVLELGKMALESLAILPKERAALAEL